MKITRKIKIDAPVENVWKALGDDFLSVDTWMAGVKNSFEINIGDKLENAPTIGRRAEVATIPGSYLEERITAYNTNAKKLTVQTRLMNSPSPLKGYDTEITVQKSGNNASEVIWASSAFPSAPMGYVFYFPIKKGLSDGFYRGLEELKCFVETGTPHERKLSDKATCG